MELTIYPQIVGTDISTGTSTKEVMVVRVVLRIVTQPVIQRLGSVL